MERAEYGTYLIKNLAREIEPEYGSGFSVRQLESSRQFYRLYPIASALRPQLNWSQYKLLIPIPDSDKREYYELEAVNEGWTGRQLERQINSMVYDSKTCLARSQQNHPCQQVPTLSASNRTVD